LGVVAGQDVDALNGAYRMTLTARTRSADVASSVIKMTLVRDDTANSRTVA